MTTILLIGLIVVVALILWLVPVDEFLKKLIYAILVVAVIVWLLGILGVWSPGGHRLGSVRSNGGLVIVRS